MELHFYSPTSLHSVRLVQLYVMAYTVNKVVINTNNTILDYPSCFINSWELLRHKVSRFIISHDPVSPFVTNPFFLKEMARLSPSEKASLSFQIQVPDFYV